MLRIAICDDSKIDSTIINEFLKEYKEKNNVEAEIRIFSHPDTLLLECETFRPHIYILDIIMPMLSGIEAAKELRFNQKESQIIFTTCDPQYALESFEVNPVNYLLKPVEKNKLFDTLDLCIKRVAFDEERIINVKSRQGIEAVYLDDILYIDYRNHIVTYHLKNNREIVTTTLRIGFLEYLRTNFEDSGIVQCHESIAVRIDAIEKLQRDSVTLVNQEVLPVSKSRYKNVADNYLRNSDRE